MSTKLASLGRTAWSLLGVAAGLALVLWIAWQFRVVFPHIVLTGAIVFLLHPLVTGLERRGIARVWGTSLTYLGLCAVLVLVGIGVTPLISQQADELAEDWPALRADMEDWLDDLAARSERNDWIVTIPTVEELRDQLGGSTSAEQEDFDRVVQSAAVALEDADEPVLAAELDRVAAAARADLDSEGGFTEQLATVREVGTRIFELGLIVILSPIMAFYVLVDLPQVAARVRALVPARARPEALFLGHRLTETIGGYFRGQVVVALIVGVMVSIGLAILGLPFWLLVGMIAGLFNMIPLIGPWVGAIPGVAIALTTSGVSTALWVVVIMTVAQQIDNHFITPAVMQRTVSLHPAAVMLVLLAGGSLAGFFGILLAVPLTATLKVIIGHVWARTVLGTPLEELRRRDAEEHGRDLPRPGPLEVIEDYVENELSMDDPGDVARDQRDEGESESDRDETAPVGQADRSSLP